MKACQFLFYEIKALPLHHLWSGARVAEEARLESVCTPKAYRGFESPSLRDKHANYHLVSVFVLISRIMFFIL